MKEKQKERKVMYKEIDFSKMLFKNIILCESVKRGQHDKICIERLSTDDLGLSDLHP